MKQLIAALLICFTTPALSQSSDPQAIRDTEIVNGKNDIAQAWLIDETQRYAHYVRGSAFEAGGLRIKTKAGKILTLTLDDDHVFEDRTPRIADFNNDGKDDIALVLSSLTKGAALALYGVEDDKIVNIAQTPFIGRAYRWLNPAGIADFNGDGQTDIAFVAMPHLVKRLEFWTLSNGKFKQIASEEGFSNHRNGSPFTGMSAIADFDGDGRIELALPSASRKSVRIVELQNNKVVERKLLPLGSAADGTFSLSGTPGKWALKIPTDNGVKTLSF